MDRIDEQDEDLTANPPVSDNTSGLEGLTIKSANDPTLGLTNVGEIPSIDWAADTGPTESPGGGLAGDDLENDASTLSRDEEVDEDDDYVPDEEGA